MIVGDPARHRDVRGGARSATRRNPPSAAANWVTGEYLGRAQSRRAGDVHVDPGELATLVDAVASGELSRTNAKRGVRAGDRDRRVRGRDRRGARGLRQISDSGALGAAIDEVLAANPDRRRRLPGREGTGDRLPRRTGHEGDARPGQRGAGAGGAPRAARSGRGGLTVGSSTSPCGASAIVLHRRRLQPRAGAVPALPGA